MSSLLPARQLLSQYGTFLEWRKGLACESLSNFLVISLLTLNSSESLLRRALFEGTKHSIAMKDEALEQFASYDPSPSSATARNGADSALLKRLV